MSEAPESLERLFHDLRTSLNAVIGFSQIIRDGQAGPMTDKQREFLDDILSAAQQMVTLINEAEEPTT